MEETYGRFPGVYSHMDFNCTPVIRNICPEIYLSDLTTTSSESEIAVEKVAKEPHSSYKNKYVTKTATQMGEKG